MYMKKLIFSNYIISKIAAVQLLSFKGIAGQARNDRVKRGMTYSYNVYLSPSQNKSSLNDLILSIAVDTYSYVLSSCSVHCLEAHFGSILSR